MKIKIASFLLVLIFLFWPFLTQAGVIPCGTEAAPSPCTLCHLIIGVKNIVSFGMGLLITVAAVGIFIAGVMYIIASGNEQAISKAKGFLSASLIGFSITLAAWFIVNIVMWILAVKFSEIQKINWYTFTC